MSTVKNRHADESRVLESKGLLTWAAANSNGNGTCSVRKRAIDIVLSTLGLAVSAPVFPLVALLIKLEDGGPVFYMQERVGERLRPFRLYKFRSMVADAERKSGPVWSTENDPRVLRVGGLLRSTACDELPQLINILKGDLSFVGPRSHRRFFFDKFSREVPRYTRRYDMRPGLSGLAQLLARYDSTAQQKLRFDLLYLKRQSIILDVKIILASFAVTLLGRWDERRGKKLRCVEAFLRFGHRRHRSGRPMVARAVADIGEEISA